MKHCGSKRKGEGRREKAKKRRTKKLK